MNKPETEASSPAGVQAFRDYATVQDYLVNLKAHGPRYGVDRMRLLAAELGHPERALPCIHVTGTNGKGSTSAMLESILRSAGWRTGLYTSPHLVRLGERVQVDRQILGEADILALTNELMPAAQRIAAQNAEDHPSFFEFMTAMAFLRFQRAACDISVIEVGMGGELDATNIVVPEVSIITSVSLDHCEFLGDTVEKIARTKAGILKPGRPVVLGRMPLEAELVVRAQAGRLGCAVHSVREHFGEDISRYPKTNLEGDYQRWNAGTATLAARVLSSGPWRLDEACITAGLQTVSWAGRWQRTRVGGKPLIFDASHNPEGAEVLRENLRSLVAESGKRPIIVTGVLGAARARAMLPVLCEFAQELRLVVPQQARACSHAELQSLLPGDFTGAVYHDTVSELFPGPGLCSVGGEGEVVIVTGSIYLLGEIMARVLPSLGEGEGRLQDF